MVSPHPESSSALLHFLRFALHLHVDSSRTRLRGETDTHTDRGPSVERKSFVTSPRWTTVDESGPNSSCLVCGLVFELAVNRKAPVPASV